MAGGKGKGRRRGINSSGSGGAGASSREVAKKSVATKKPPKETGSDDANKEKEANYWEGGRFLRSRTGKDNLRCMLPINELSFDFCDFVSTPKPRRARATSAAESKAGDYEEKTQPVLSALDMSPLRDQLEDLSVLPTPAPAPVPPEPPTLTFGYRCAENDVMMEAFANIGHCTSCTARVEPRDMLLCECKEFMCTNCFLKGHFCKNAPDADTQAQSQPDANSYHLDQFFFQKTEINGEEYSLEIQLRQVNA